MEETGKRKQEAIRRRMPRERTIIEGGEPPSNTRSGGEVVGDSSPFSVWNIKKVCSSETKKAYFRPTFSMFFDRVKNTNEAR